MAKITFDITEGQAAALTLKAQAEGLTLEEWFCRAAAKEAAAPSEQDIDENRREMSRRFVGDVL